MQHEKIIKRPDGSRIRIHVSFWTDLRGAKYNITVSICEPRKRTFRYIDVNDYEFRRLPMSEREDYMLAHYLKHVTAEEILQAKIELWEMMKPVL